MTELLESDKLKAKNQILHLLKLHGPQTAAVLAAQLQVSAMAIRQHLQTLQADNLVTYQEERRPVGRPIKQWQLTEKAAKRFPDNHAELLVNVLQGVEQLFGQDGLDALLAKRTQQQIDNYQAQLPEDGWQAQVKTIAQLRAQEGYMAEVVQEAEDAVLLIENHCAIHSAARTCSQICASELQVFSALLGSDVKIERVEHLIAGDRRCAYRISSAE
ncbi:metalloregulator ArsR/SmtB family transcription factor [Leptolyngbya sp. FACHB-711]|uniref:helix-turn-helix transcriptional regulator n=1 Tax=unclassified Leptolyngbya TaxID=2650499 RepID=UPI001686B83B|nr:metalloregulator ArsR/SmtB family transcription factor [Leptolyngbya sp. FACHB-711]MBD1849201.1 transcriptional regulator [Cyanobacteria bacterium FACHB-502]MBD2025141.1 transcriptional regulator [Leptolyngbya sp. FACHB-711]